MQPTAPVASMGVVGARLDRYFGPSGGRTTVLFADDADVALGVTGAGSAAALLATLRSLNGCRALLVSTSASLFPGGSRAARALAAEVRATVRVCGRPTARTRTKGASSSSGGGDPFLRLDALVLGSRMDRDLDKVAAVLRSHGGGGTKKKVRQDDGRPPRSS
jgi:hypothetical protein